MRFLFIAAVYLFIPIQEIFAISTTEDREFLISTPSTNRLHDAHFVYPRVTLMMMSIENNTVTIISEHIRNPDVFVNLTFNLKAMVTKSFYKNYAFFGLDVASGKRWTYHLIGKRAFSLLVVLMDDERTVETLTAVPVAGWGKRYTVATLWSQISIVLINYKDDNTIAIKLKSKDLEFSVKIGRGSYKSGQKAYVQLIAYQSYAISTCHKNDKEGSVSGTFFEGTKLFGMISGHCRAFTYTRSCDAKNKKAYSGVSGRLVAEMLLPVETFGRFFVLFRITVAKWTGVYVVVATEDKSNGWITNKTHKERVELTSAGDSNMIEALNGVLECGCPCFVVYYQNSSCIVKERSGMTGDPTMATITPIELYYFIYNIMVPPTEMKHYVLIVIPQKDGENIFSLRTYFEAQEDPIIELINSSATIIFTKTYWGQFEVYPYMVKKNSSFITLSRTTRFGCFLYGVNNDSTYMHPAGMVSSNINKKYCLHTAQPMFADDLVDNDCDGKVDEEDLDNLDDDKDGGKNEDNRYLYNKKNITDGEFVKLYQKTHPSNYYQKPLNFTLDTELPKDVPPEIPQEEPDMRTTQITQKPPAGGETKQPYTSRQGPTQSPEKDIWQPWTDWHCSLDCKNPSMVRERSCKKPNSSECRQPQTETSKKGTCNVPQTCPKARNTALYIPAIMVTLIIPLGIIAFFLLQRRHRKSLDAAASDDFQTKSTVTRSEASEKSEKSEKSTRDSQFSSSADSET